MFDYGRKLQLALNDRLRRGGLVAGAITALAIGAGFLLAALWVWLAHHLHWGALGASLAIGMAFVLAGMIVLALARKPHHPMPTGEELRAELGQQLQRTAKAAVSRATDATLRRAAKGAGSRSAPGQSQAFRMSDDPGRGAGDRRPQGPDDAARGASAGRAAALAPLIAGLAVGVTLAARLWGGRRRDPPAEEDGAE